MTSQHDKRGSANGAEVVNGHPVVNGTSPYSVQAEAVKIFYEGILGNDRVRNVLPKDALTPDFPINFTGSPVPSIPINWRQAESVSALTALEATLVNVLLQRKYGLRPQAVTIDTDHATLYIMSCLVWTLDPEGRNISINGDLRPGLGAGFVDTHFPPCDKHRLFLTLHRGVASNWYRCSDGKYIHLHGSMNPDPTLEAIGLPPEMEASSPDEAIKHYKDAVAQISSEELQHRVSDIYKVPGQINLTTEEFWASEHGKANANIDLFEVHDRPNAQQPRCWWPTTPQTSPRRPLAGLKVVDLTRILAGPSIGRGLAELGASVMRVTAQHLPDFGILHPDTNWGKWNCHLDLRQETDRERLRELILDADVVINGYRPESLAKYGFGQQGIIDLCAGREQGIISARENTYGWHGPWQDRSGWQQISDACVGVADSFGKALGLDEPVTPIFPNSDYCTGLAGICAILIAILRRGERGGSFAVDVSLNYYNQWLVRCVGTYPEAIFWRMRDETGHEDYRHWHTMGNTFPRMLRSLQDGPAAARLFKDEFFELRDADVALGPGKKIRAMAPAIRFDSGKVQLGYHVGTRPNGVDAARWPEDLTVQQVFH